MLPNLLRTTPSAVIGPVEVLACPLKPWMPRLLRHRAGTIRYVTVPSRPKDAGHLVRPFYNPRKVGGLAYAQ
jgi:hypothetical protein